MPLDPLRSFAELAPIYFVLGNHDFYRGSIDGVRSRVRELCREVPNLHWMPNACVISLGETTCLVGHDGWDDGRLGDFFGSDVLLNDFALIAELRGFWSTKEERLSKLHALGDEAVSHVRTVLPGAPAQFEHVIVLTHVPPLHVTRWH